MNIETLKSKYNVGIIPEEGIDCSVGGALCIEMTPEEERLRIWNLISFPSALILADFLSIENPFCGEILILEYAEKVFGFNSQGKIEEAWEELDKALQDRS